MPLPHISASQPSALNIRMRASARSDGQIRISPSPPTPKCRSAIRRATPRGPRHRLVEAIDVDVVVAGAVHFDKSHRSRFLTGGPPRRCPASFVELARTLLRAGIYAWVRHRAKTTTMPERFGVVANYTGRSDATEVAMATKCGHLQAHACTEWGFSILQPHLLALWHRRRRYSSRRLVSTPAGCHTSRKGVRHVAPIPAMVASLVARSGADG